MKELKTLSHTENGVLKTNICKLEESNTQLENEVSHLHASIDELREEVVPLQEDNNHVFDEY
jgi:FtsZ-binding cell division protein ZapB